MTRTVRIDDENRVFLTEGYSADRLVGHVVVADTTSLFSPFPYDRNYIPVLTMEELADIAKAMEQHRPQSQEKTA